MIKLDFTPEFVAQLHFVWYNHPYPHIQKKIEIIYLISTIKITYIVICNITKISSNTLRSFIKQYNEYGLKKLKEIKFFQPKSELELHSIEEYLSNFPPATIAEASHKIEQLTGVKRGLTQTSVFLKSLEAKLPKVGVIRAKVLTEEKKEQAVFLEKEMKLRLNEAVDNKRVVNLFW